MNELIAPLTAFSAAIAGRQPHRFQELVKAAYEAGATREELFVAVDSVRGLLPLPAPLVGQAFASIHTWYWMESGRERQRREVARLAV